ncbi:MAG TPA: nucleotide exchange factor GrpE [Fimbriimonadaceae bacterium]|nr:nucleotide exchange factor GrpE [Fimbriimonadaceae bacterium]
MKGRNKSEQEGVDLPPQASDGQDAVDQDLNALMTAVQKAIDERNQLQDQLLRTMADFQNYRKRQEEQRKQLETFATERLVRALLPVLDNFERALASLSSGATSESIEEGLKAVDRQLRQVLEGQNVSRIPSVGHPFDPEVHEALALEPSEEHEDNTVIGELEAGYKMGERVIRPARVRVARKP